MSDNIISFFDQHQQKKKEEATQKAYQAVVVEHTGRRAYGIRINYSSGEVLLIDYSYFKYAVSESSDRLILVFTIGAVILSGRNLRLLLDDLLDQRIRLIQPFEPNHHKPLKDGEPVIDSITWQSMKTIHSLLPSTENQVVEVQA